MPSIPFFQSLTARILMPALLLPAFFLAWGLWFYHALIQEQLLHEADIRLVSREQAFIHYLESEERHLMLLAHQMGARLNEAFHQLPDTAPEIPLALRHFKEEHSLSGLALLSAEDHLLHASGLNPFRLLPVDQRALFLRKIRENTATHLYQPVPETKTIQRIVLLPLQAGRLLLLAAPLRLFHDQGPSETFLFAFGAVQPCGRDCPSLPELGDLSLASGIQRVRDSNLFIRTRPLPGLADETVRMGTATRLDTDFTLIPLSMQVHLLAGILIFILLSLFMGKTLTGVRRSLLQIRRAALAIAEGDFSPPLPLASRGEIGLLARALSQMARRLEENLKALTEARQGAEAAYEALKVSEDQYRVLASTASELCIGILVADEGEASLGKILHVNAHMATLCGKSAEELRDRCRVPDLLFSDDAGQSRLRRSDGENLPVENVSCSSVFDGSPARVYYIRDISSQLHTESQLRDYNQNLQRMVEQHTEELRQTLSDLREAQSQLIHAEKMAALGHLAAGVAHEINNPVGFVKSNLGTIRDYFQDLFALINAQQALEPLLPSDENTRGLLETIRQIRARMDFDFIRKDHQAVITESMEGIQRVARIVSDLKNFSHAGNMEKEPTDVEQCLESTLNIVWNEIKYKAEIVRDFVPLPEVSCIPQKLSQVFMNILVNAAQAIEKQGTITLRTRLEDRAILVEISDTGGGIPPEVLPRIFDPFFTTKPVGKGTGLGLNISYNLMHQMGGDIHVRSTPGAGATFTVRIPWEPAPDLPA